MIRQALANARVQHPPISITSKRMAPARRSAIRSKPTRWLPCSGPAARRFHPLVIGSVKTNIGHLESAAGVTGLIKVVLSLQNERNSAAPALSNDESAHRLERGSGRGRVQGSDWKRGAKPRLAGVSSFGFSGTNAHVILDEAPQIEPRPDNSPAVHLLPLSARTETALDAIAGRFRDRLANSGVNLADACFTAAAGRAHLSHRAVYVAGSREDMQARLLEPPAIAARSHSRDELRVAFLFSGQGAQYPGMGRELFGSQPVFRRAIEECAEAFGADLQPGLIELLYGDASHLLDDTHYTQPVLFAVEYALAQLWRSWGVEPAAVLGHSVGEYAAACVAGFCPAAEAAALIAARGRLMGGLPRGEGAMAAILAPEEQVLDAVSRLGGEVSIAGLNGPENVTIAGRAGAVQRVGAKFAASGFRVEPLRVSHAFHSALMEPIETAFADRAAQVEFRTPRASFVSTVTGKTAGLSDLKEPAYWRRQVREPVRFRDAMQTLAAKGCRIFVEIGPGSTLLGMGRNCIAGEGTLWLPSIRRAKADPLQMAESLAQLYVRGADVNWDAYYAGQRRRRVALPAYPFERQRYWIDDLKPLAPRQQPSTDHPLLGERVEVAGGVRAVLWQSSIGLQSHPWVAGHRVHGSAILPMTGFLEMMSAALRSAHPGEKALGNVVVAEPLVVTGEPVAIQVVAKDKTIEVYSRCAGDWKLHASAVAADTRPQPGALDIAALRSGLAPGGVAALYEGLARRGHEFGPGFRLVTGVFTGAGTALVSVDALSHRNSGFITHPAVLDACVQSIAGAIDERSGSYLPLSAGYFEFASAPLPERLWSRADVRASGQSLIADIAVVDDDGHTVARLLDLELRRVGERFISRLDKKVDESVFFTSVWERAQNSTSAIGAADTSTIAAGVRPLTGPVAAQFGLDAYPMVREHTNRLCSLAIAGALDSLGAPLLPGQRFDSAGLASRCGVIPRHRMLLERLLEILAEDGVLRPYAAGWECVRVPSSVAAGWQEHESRNPSFAAEIAITARCATNLAAVLKGAADPLHVLFPGGSTETAERLYSESPSAKTFNTLLAQAVRTASSSLESGRTLRVLEIGGGTGGSSVFVLPALPAGRTNYVFTDISPLFVARARERFAAFPFVTYSTLDIEKDPAKQGFKEGEFDLIVAANVVHATANLSQTLEHVSRLLAPGGLLLMLEVTQKERWIDLSFGMTEGWWKFEDRDLRPSYPLLAADRWKSLLTRSGFSNVETVELSRESLNAILIARRPSATLHTGENWLVVGESKNTALISAGLSAAGAQVTCASNDVEAVIRAKPWTGLVYVAPQRSTADIRDAEAAICRPLFDIVHSMDLTASRLFVVTEGAQPATLNSVRNPEQATLWGAARTLASEYPGLGVVCIDLDPAAPARAVDLLIADVAAQDGEPEIAYRDGLRFVRRLNPAPLEKAERLRLSVEARGLIDNLCIEPAQRIVPGREQVEIEVDVAAIGFRDVLNVLGMYPGDPGPLGAECAGRIVAVGPGVREFAVGDSVVAVAPGCHNGYVLADARLVAHRPAGLTPEVAMTLPVPYLTAIYALEHLGHIRAGDSVLIHSGAGGVGFAAIQIAQRAGAEVFATAGSEEKRELLLSLGVTHV